MGGLASLLADVLRKHLNSSGLVLRWEGLVTRSMEAHVRMEGWAWPHGSAVSHGSSGAAGNWAGENGGGEEDENHESRALHHRA